MSDSILVVKDLKKSYGEHQVLKGVSFAVKKGDVYGLMGPNGVGKTTTLKIIVDMLQADHGEIYYKGIIKGPKKNLNSYIGVSIEEPCFYGNLSGLQNLMIYASLVGTNKETVLRILGIFELTEAKDVKVKKYSQGMKQRLSIARVFLNDPEIIILDEPTNGLDPNGIKSMREMIQRLSTEFKKTIILSTHLLNEAKYICNRFGIISDGVIVIEEEMSAISDKLGNSEYAFEEFFIKFTDGGTHD